MKHIAFIDLGSNSVRFVIIEIADNGSYQLIYQQKESIRLSEGMWEKQKLTIAAMMRAIKTLLAFSHMAEAMNCDEIIAVATAAVRLAKNGQAFIDMVREQTGISIRCISGEEEANYGFLGVINTIALRDFVLFDLGGASVEVSLVRNRRVVKSVSLPMGALTLTGAFQSGKEFTDKEYESMVAHIRKLLAKQDWLKHTKLPLIGIGGTIRNIAKIDQRKYAYPVTKLHNYQLTAERLQEVMGLVRGRNLSQRRKISGLSTERADIIIAGVTVVNELLSYVGAECILVSGCGLREGLFYKYYGENYMNPSGIIDDILLHSTENVLLSSPQNNLIHAKYIANICDTLYEEWAPIHGYGKRTGDLLRVAALLHDIGKEINYYNHAKHSAYVIVNCNLYGLTHVEQAMCAFIAACSHGANGRFVKRTDYGKLLTPEQQEEVMRVSTILALAEAIDESHEQPAMSLTSTITNDKVEVTIWKKKGTHTTIADVAINQLQKQFKRDYKRKLVVIWKPTLS